MTNADPKEQLYRWLNRILFILLPVVAFFTIQDYGMGWDEVTRWESGDAKVEYYKELFSSEDPISVIRNTGADSYPGLFDISLSVLYEITSGDRFLMGHWLAFLFGYLGLVALWRIAFIFGGARLAFWSVLLLVLTPSFYGHWFQNPKDIPFAATYTVGLWALIECFRYSPRLDKRRLAGAAVACGLCMATRIAGMVLLAYFAGALMVLVAVHLWEKRHEQTWLGNLRELSPWFIGAPLFGLFAYLTLLPWWPAAHKNLLSVSATTLQRLHVSASEIPLFFRGEIIWAADAPAYYAVWMFAIKATEVLLIGLLLCLPFAYMLFRRRMTGNVDLKGAPILSILLMGAFFPLVYLTLSAPALHNGARHFLFAFPALSVCSAWGLLSSLQWLREYQPRLLRFAQGALALLLLLPVVHLFRLHPYQYIYYNSLAGGTANAFQSYEGEYWFTSSKHAVEQLKQYVSGNPEVSQEDQITKVSILGPWQVAEPFLPDDFELTNDPAKADYFILNTQMRMHERFAGDEIFRIERMGAAICVIKTPSK